LHDRALRGKIARSGQILPALWNSGVKQMKSEIRISAMDSISFFGFLVSEF
jgi:hypothetical protein